MNVLYVTQNYESVQKHLYEGFKSAAARVDLVHYRMVNGGAEESFPDGVTYIASRVRVKGFLFYMLKLRRIYVKCKRKMEGTPIDIMHGNMLFCDGYICRKLSKAMHVPYCVSVRDTDINSGFLWKLPWTRRMGLQNIADASAIFFLSQKYQEKLIEKAPAEYKERIIKKSFVIPNGIDDYYIKNAFCREKTELDSVRLIFVGKISKRKNLETIVAACKILIERGKRVELNVVGPMVERSYEAIMKDTPFIKYHGVCSKEQVLEHLRASDIFVMPSHTETFGLVYLEAMTQGLPVIYTRGQGFDGQFPDGTVGYAVNDRSPEEIAEKILSVIADYPRLSKNATAYGSECSWGRAVKRFMDAYRTVVE